MQRVLVLVAVVLTILLIGIGLALVVFIVMAAVSRRSALTRPQRAYMLTSCFPLLLTIVIPPVMTLGFHWDLRQNLVLTKSAFFLGAALAAVGAVLCFRETKNKVPIAVATVVSTIPIIAWIIMVVMWRLVKV